MSRSTAIITLLAVIGVCTVWLTLALCGGNRPFLVQEFGVGSVEQDSWTRQVPHLDWSQWSAVSPELVVPAPEESRTEAVKRLDDAALQALTDADLKAFTPAPAAVPSDYKPYLIRCVFMQDPYGRPMGTGHFYVYRSGLDVLTFFGCLGHRSWGTGRGALVVWLPFKPANVFVESQMDE